MEVSVQLQDPAALTLVKNPGTRLMGGWKRPEFLLDIFKGEKYLPLPGLELRILQLVSWSLYQLGYPGISA
jgi:hypothetical protein